jgi:hypothetical protein
VPDFSEHKADLGHVCLMRAFPQIRVKRRQQVRLAGFQQALQNTELGTPELKRPRGSGLEKLPLAGNSGGMAHFSFAQFWRWVNLPSIHDWKSRYRNMG